MCYLYRITLVAIVCFSQANGFPLFRRLTEADAKAEERAFHLFPAWVAELGEIALIILDVVWHHDIVENIHQVSHQVSQIDAKIDALLAASPMATRVFQMRESQDFWYTLPIQVKSSVVDESDDTHQGSWMQFVWTVTAAAIKLANWVSPLILVA